MRGAHSQKRMEKEMMIGFVNKLMASNISVSPKCDLEKHIDE